MQWQRLASCSPNPYYLELPAKHFLASHAAGCSSRAGQSHKTERAWIHESVNKTSLTEYSHWTVLWTRKEKSIVFCHCYFEVICSTTVSLHRLLQMSKTELDSPTQIPSPTNLLYLGNSLVTDALLHFITQDRSLDIFLFLIHTSSPQTSSLGSISVLFQFC